MVEARPAEPTKTWINPAKLMSLDIAQPEPLSRRGLQSYRQSGLGGGKDVCTATAWGNDAIKLQGLHDPRLRHKRPMRHDEIIRIMHLEAEIADMQKEIDRQKLKAVAANERLERLMKEMGITNPPKTGNDNQC